MCLWLLYRVLIFSLMTLLFHFCSLPYFETSAATGNNVAKAVECLLDKVMLRMEQAVDKSNASARNGRKLGNELKEADEDKGCGC